MRIPLRHLLFWILIYILWAYMKGGDAYFTRYLVVNLVNVPIYMMAFYFLKEVQIPFFFKQDKIPHFLISIILSSFVLYLIWRINGELWIDRWRGFKSTKFMSTIGYLNQAVQFYSPAMALLVIDSFYERKKEQERIQELEKEKLSTELKFLKAQLNPHFLFNTLNNLYSFVVNGSPLAADMILRLSGVLDYVLYKSQQKFVLLKDEIMAIENFVELEKIRYGDRLEVELEWKGNMDFQVSPLLLLSMVENAFKHGASGDIDRPKIKIDIVEQDEKLSCQIWNTKSANPGELNDGYKEGIGLSNIKRQLDLVYPERHELLIQNKEASYAITATIDKIK